MHFRRLIASNWIFFVWGRTSNPTSNKCPSMIDEIHFFISLIFFFVLSPCFTTWLFQISRDHLISYFKHETYFLHTQQIQSFSSWFFEWKLIYFCWRLLEKRYFYCSSRVFVYNNCHIKLTYNDYRYLSLKIETSC